VIPDPEITLFSFIFTPESVKAEQGSPEFHMYLCLQLGFTFVG